MTSFAIFDDRACELGEGALWHPELQQFFWFDILGRRLLTRDASGPREWSFDRLASAAGWIDRDRLLVATETGLAVFTLSSGRLDDLISVDADRPDTRSNDGRADRQGGFWFGTMGKAAQAGQGAIYRFCRGEVRRLVDAVTIPNSICFSPDGRTAYFSDTRRRMIWRLDLDADGWPASEPGEFLDMTPDGLSPDGAQVDSEGGLWVALWGQGAVIRLDAQGQQTARVEVGGQQSSCPCFGGSDLRQMLVTTAYEGMDLPDAGEGLTYLVTPGATGLPEPRVVL